MFIKQQSLALLSCAFVVAMFGADVGDAHANSCFSDPAELSDDAKAAFGNDPDSLLVTNPQGGFGMTTRVRSLAGSDTDALGALIELAGKANDAQIAALGSGLGQAATACLNSQPDIATQIQQAVAESGEEVLIAVFAASTGDTQTAAIGPIGGTGGSGAGGATGIGSDGGDGGIGGVTASTVNSGSTLSTGVNPRTFGATTQLSGFSLTTGGSSAGSGSSDSSSSPSVSPN